MVEKSAKFKFRLVPIVRLLIAIGQGQQQLQQSRCMELAVKKNGGQQTECLRTIAKVWKRYVCRFNKQFSSFFTEAAIRENRQYCP